MFCIAVGVSFPGAGTGSGLCLGDDALLTLLVEGLGLHHGDDTVAKGDEDERLLRTEGADERTVGGEVAVHLIVEDALAAGGDDALTGEGDGGAVDGERGGVAMGDAYPTALYPLGHAVGRGCGGVEGVVDEGLVAVAVAAAALATTAEVEEQQEEEEYGDDAPPPSSATASVWAHLIATDLAEVLLVVGEAFLGRLGGCGCGHGIGRVCVVGLGSIEGDGKGCATQRTDGVDFGDALAEGLIETVAAFGTAEKHGKVKREK